MPDRGDGTDKALPLERAEIVPERVFRVPTETRIFLLSPSDRLSHSANLSSLVRFCSPVSLSREAVIPSRVSLA